MSDECTNFTGTCSNIVTPTMLANTFVKKFGKDNDIEHMKLQKLCYYAYGWWLAYHDDPLLSEAPQVWKYGPVFNSMFHVFKPFKSTPIKTPQKDNPFAEPEFIQDSQILAFIDWIWNRYSPYSAITLSDMTHEEGTPWKIMAEQRGYRVPKNTPIDNNLIKSYFQQEGKKLLSSK